MKSCLQTRGISTPGCFRCSDCLSKLQPLSPVTWRVLAPRIAAHASFPLFLPKALRRRATLGTGSPGCIIRSRMFFVGAPFWMGMCVCVCLHVCMFSCFLGLFVCLFDCFFACSFLCLFICLLVCLLSCLLFVWLVRWLFASFVRWFVWLYFEGTCYKVGLKGVQQESHILAGQRESTF